MKKRKASQSKEEKLRQLLLLEREIRDRLARGYPGAYGLPDLLFPRGFKQGVYDPEMSAVTAAEKGWHVTDGWVREPLGYEESEEAYIKRQHERLASFVGETLYVIKDGKKTYVKLIPPIIKWVGDVFFGRVRKTITWKPRGGGGSLSAAVLIWLLLIYWKREILDVAGSGEQSKVVYDYVKMFWDAVPGLRDGLLLGDPLSDVTRLVTGVLLKCVPATEKQGRGKHFGTIFVDEVCQEDRRVEKAMRAALQGALSEPDSIVCLFSTFHIPHGLFQEYWDGYREKGFQRYNWNVFDTMERCTRGLEEATEDDPEALEYCKRCYLTDRVLVDGPDGKKTEVFKGCYGKARHSDGWATFKMVSEAKEMNAGTTVFETEFACERPSYSSCVYAPELIEASLTDPILIDSAVDRAAVGIDWGIQSQGSMVMILGIRTRECVYIHEAEFTDHVLVSDVATKLRDWKTLFGEFPVLADSSHPFNNAELSSAGFDVRPINFGTWKKIGIENVSKYFVFRRIRINKALEILIEQLKAYRRSETTGAILKKKDHGPDALMCLMMNFRFEDEFGPDIEKASAAEVQTRLLEAKKAEKQRRAMARKFDEDGLNEVAVDVPDFVVNPFDSAKYVQNVIVV